jgi:hypothetical protein
MERLYIDFGPMDLHGLQVMVTFNESFIPPPSPLTSAKLNPNMLIDPKIQI